MSDMMVEPFLWNTFVIFSFSVISKRCQNLLLQIYLHFPEVIQHVTLPEGTFSSGGAAYSNSCKVN